VKNKVRIGYWDRTCKTPLHFPGDSHLCLTASSGQGKLRDILAGAMIEHKSSMLTVDTKGELCCVTGRARSKIGKVVVLNPFSIWPEHIGRFEHAGFNPLSVLNPRAKSFGLDCDAIAEAIDIREGGGSDDSFFNDSARSSVSGIIMALAKYAPADKRNLVEMYRIITGPDFFRFVAWALDQAKKCGDILLPGRIGRFGVQNAHENRTLVGIKETAVTLVGFIGNDAIAESLNPRGHELRFSTLRQELTTVYLILPTEYLAGCMKWFRLVMVSAMTEFVRPQNQGGQKVLVLMDEFKSAIGRLSIITQMMGIGRGYGVQLWPVLQDLNQLVELYPRDWRTFLANCGAQIYFSPKDSFTLDEIAKQIFVREIAVPRTQFSPVQMWEQEGQQENPIGLGVHVDQIPRALMLNHEIASMGADQMLVFAENLGVILAGRKPYMKTREYAGKFDPNPYHAGANKSWWSW
jgi:type IV secretion system protein VirD4